MKKILHFTFATFLLLSMVACGGPKAVTNYSPTSELDKTITSASIKLKKNPSNKKQIQALRDAYKAATTQDLALLERLKEEAKTDPAKWTAIYDVYDRMQIREIAVVPLLPLYLDDREVAFDVPNIDRATEESKQRASEQLYDAAVGLMATGNKNDARKAYDYLDQLTEFNYEYRDARDIRAQAKIKGSTNVYVSMINNTGKTLPTNFESDLLSIRDGAFTDSWISYHTTKSAGLFYDYDITLKVNQVIVGQDRIERRNYREQARVQTGTEDAEDKDGKPIKVPVYQEVYADIYEITKVKPIRIEATAEYKDNRTGEVKATIPLEREEQWVNISATGKGDQRAVSQETAQKLQTKEEPFPTNQQLLDFGGKLLNQVVVQMMETNAKNLES